MVGETINQSKLCRSGLIYSTNAEQTSDSTFILRRRQEMILNDKSLSFAWMERASLTTTVKLASA